MIPTPSKDKISSLGPIEKIKVKIATKKNVLKKEIVSPGHVFPIISKEKLHN